MKNQTSGGWLVFLIIIGNVLLVLIIGNKALSLMSIGMVSFFGILQYARIHAPQDSNLDSGEVRKAIAGSIILVYFYVLAISLFKDTNISFLESIPRVFSGSNGSSTATEAINFGESLIESLTQLVQVVVGFYFGGRSAEEIVKSILTNKESAQSGSPRVDDVVTNNEDSIGDDSASVDEAEIEQAMN